MPNPKFFESPAAFRAWLEANHETETELLVGFYKTKTGRPSITWPESVDEALCFGWIDGVRRSLGEEAYTIRFTPRKATSIWSAVNVGRIAELEKLGKLTDAGRRAFERRRADRTGVYGHERDTPAELEPAWLARFKRSKAAWTFFEGQAPSYRRIAFHWVMNAKKPETRLRRFEQLLSSSGAGERVGPFAKPTRR